LEKYVRKNFVILSKYFIHHILLSWSKGPQIHFLLTPKNYETALGGGRSNIAIRSGGGGRHRRASAFDRVHYRLLNVIVRHRTTISDGYEPEN
jgi:hypothetical protein